MAFNGQQKQIDRCPLLEVKWTSAGHASMSAYDPFLTSSSRSILREGVL
jgi:hypothetical protein